MREPVKLDDSGLSSSNISCLLNTYRLNPFPANASFTLTKASGRAQLLQCFGQKQFHVDRISSNTFLPSPAFCSQDALLAAHAICSSSPKIGVAVELYFAPFNQHLSGQ